MTTENAELQEVTPAQTPLETIEQGLGLPDTLSITDALVLAARSKNAGNKMPQMPPHMANLFNGGGLKVFPTKTTFPESFKDDPVEEKAPEDPEVTVHKAALSDAAKAAAEEKRERRRLKRLASLKA